MKEPRTRRAKTATADAGGAARRPRPTTPETVPATPLPPPQTAADILRLMAQMREANERLIVAAVRAQDQSDEAEAETAEAREDVHTLLRHLQEANDRLAAGAVQAHAMAEDARAREEEYRQLSSRLLVVQDEERRRLALDLHDPIGQHLAALAMQLDVIEQRATTLDAGAHHALAQSRALADQCAREVRTFAYLLHPPLLDEMGLRSAVRWYVEGFTKRSGIRVAVKLADVGRLSQPLETALFRVVQESLTNVHRHAQTATASIRLAATAARVTLEVRDRGHGAGERLVRETGLRRSEGLGVGIQGMRERIRQLGGTFDITFSEKGTSVRVAVPLHEVPA